MGSLGHGGGAFIGARGRLGVRVQGGRGEACLGRTRVRVPVGREVGGGSDRWVPPVGERGREEVREWAGAREAGWSGELGLLLGCGEQKEKEKENVLGRWGWAERGEKARLLLGFWVFHFLFQI